MNGLNAHDQSEPCSFARLSGACVVGAALATARPTADGPTTVIVEATSARVEVTRPTLNFFITTTPPKGNRLSPRINVSPPTAPTIRLSVASPRLRTHVVTICEFLTSSKH